MDPFALAIAAADIGLRLFDRIASLEGGQLSPEYVQRKNDLLNLKADAMQAKADAIKAKGGGANGT